MSHKHVLHSCFFCLNVYFISSYHYKKGGFFTEVCHVVSFTPLPQGPVSAAPHFAQHPLIWPEERVCVAVCTRYRKKNPPLPHSSQRGFGHVRTCQRKRDGDMEADVQFFMQNSTRSLEAFGKRQASAKHQILSNHSFNYMPSTTPNLFKLVLTIIIHIQQPQKNT